MTRLAVLLLALGGLAACETTQGFGRDVQATGATISQGAAGVQQELQ